MPDSSDKSNKAETAPLIVLVIDGLNAPMLGPYGNTSVETPSLNRLAAESILLDFAISSSPQLAEFCAAWWTEALTTNQSLLVSDDETVSQIAADYFDRIIEVKRVAIEKLATEPGATQAARFFVEAIEALESVEPGDLCWLHCQGLAGAWDAPYKMREFFADEEDPEPPTSPERPIADFDAATGDPDELLGYQQSAYAQIALLDDFIGLLLDRIKAHPLLQYAGLVVTSPRGYPLGEHGTVGQWNNLFSESLHVPLFFKPPSKEKFAGHRNHWLMQTKQIKEMIALHYSEQGSGNRNSDQGLPWPVESTTKTDQSATTQTPSTPAQQRAISSVDYRISLQNSDWKLIVNRDPDQVEEIKLFSKPDDRWEVNDVSNRCPQVVEDMLGELSRDSF